MIFQSNKRKLFNQEQDIELMFSLIATEANSTMNGKVA